MQDGGGGDGFQMRAVSVSRRAGQKGSRQSQGHAGGEAGFGVTINNRRSGRDLSAGQGSVVACGSAQAEAQIADLQSSFQNYISRPLTALGKKAFSRVHA